MPQKYFASELRHRLFSPADPSFGFVLLATPQGYSIYHAGTLSVRKPFARHYSLLANYTFSKSIDLATDVQLTDTPTDYLKPNLDRAVGDMMCASDSYSRCWRNLPKRGPPRCAISLSQC
jgi:hypothetical protein